MATMEVVMQTIMQAMQKIAEQQHDLQGVVGQLAQSSISFKQDSQEMLKELAKPKLDRGGKTWNDINHYKNVKMFSGDNKEWEEFMFKFKGQVAVGSSDANDIIEYIEAKVSEEELERDDYAEKIDLEAEYDEDWVVEISRKVYNLLLNLTTGEANAMIRRCRERNGLLAWKKLCTSMNPRTLASGIKMISQAMNPPKVNDPKKVDTAIDIWEDKLAKLSVEYGETLSNKVKVATLYGMLPKDLQERVLDRCAISWDKANEQDAAAILTRLKEEVKNIAKSRREMQLPKPMEVDEVMSGESGEQEDEQGWGEESEENIYQVGQSKGKGKGKGACYSCGQLGHRAFECTNRGTGKGPKGKGKGENKGGVQLEARPRTRACFGCGSTEHLFRACPQNPNKHVQEVSAGEEQEVLFIGHTEAEEKPKKMTYRQERPPGLEMISTHNRFDVLQDPEEYRVCQVEKTGGSWADLGLGDITVDSAADESCWPKGLGGAFEMKESNRNIKLKVANGSDMGHYGEKDVTFREKSSGDVMGLKFQVTDVRKPLLAVRRLIEKNNVVQFGPKPEQNYIHNLDTGKKVMMENVGGSYVIKANFVKWIGSEEQGFTRQAR